MAASCRRQTACPLGAVARLHGRAGRSWAVEQPLDAVGEDGLREPEQSSDKASGPPQLFGPAMSFEAKLG